MEIRRPLKKPKLGPPDIYPQDPKQKEDELTSVNVKQGYSSAPLVSTSINLDEFGSAKNANIDAFGVFFSALLSEKHRIDTLKDTQKKKQLVNTKEIWYVHAKTKHAVDNWFRDLANGTKSLGQLGKRIPIFNSKEGMFSQLYESHVPLAKAVWFIKMSAVHAIALSESSSKSKKRQVPDQCQELTAALIKYLKEISIKMFESHQHLQQQHQQLHQQHNQGQQMQPQQLQQQPQPPMPQSQQPHLLSASQQSPFQQQQSPQYTFNQWQYQTQLARYLFDEGLLDQYDFLCFLLELIEKKRQISELFVKIICPLILEYVIDFSRSAVLSRRLAHVCARKLHQALHQHPMTSKSWLSKRGIESVHNKHAMNFSNTLNNFGITSDNLMGKDFSLLSQTPSSSASIISSSRHNCFDSRIPDTQTFALTRNSSPTANNTHLTANSILDIVKAQIIESHNSLVDRTNLDQENSESNLYKNAIYILSAILQVICIECPTAMVRHHIVEAKLPQMFQGSPLDHLPCLPSSLPMLDSDLNFELRKSIHDAEREILHRSAMADSKWSCESSNRAGSSKASLVNRLLTVMDILDKHNFDRIDSSNSIDILYSKIFPSTENSLSSKSTYAQNSQSSSDLAGNRNNITHLNAADTQNAASAAGQSGVGEHNLKKSKNQQAMNSLGSLSSINHHPLSDQSNELASGAKNQYDEHVIKLLCEWATTTQRTGEHRALIVARLLEKRQAKLQAVLLEAARACNSQPSTKTKKIEDLKSSNMTNEANTTANATSPKTPATEHLISSNQNENIDTEQEEIFQHTFQNLLVQFLDENAPVVDDGQSENSLDNKKSFNNLVLLFSELIHCDVFSHYNYMCTLISRGMFNDLSRGSSGNSGDSASIDSPAPNSNLNPPGSVKPPRSVGKESDSLLSNSILGGGNSSIFPLSVSAPTNKQSNHIDPLSGSMGFSPDSSQQTSQSLYKGPSSFDHHSDDVDVDISLIAQRVNERDQEEDNDFKSPDYVVGSSPREDSNNKPTQLNKLSLFDERSASLDTTAQGSSNVLMAGSFPPNSVESTKPVGLASSLATGEKLSLGCSSNEQRHGAFVRHFPVPDDEYYSRDINQRMILLYGFGKERDEARHPMRKLSKEITKIIRKAARDFNDGGKLTKFALKEGYNTEAILNKFEKLNHYDQHEITNDLSDLILEIFTVELAKLGKDENDSYLGTKKAPCLLPTLESLSFAFSLFNIASNVSGLLDLIVPLLEKLTDVRSKTKDKCERLANDYTHSIALCIISMLYRYHSCVLLLPENELCSIFKSLQKLVNDIYSPNECRTSAERVIFVYLHDLVSQAGQVFDNSHTAKFKQLPQAPTKSESANLRHEYIPILTSLVDNSGLCPSNASAPMANLRPPNAPLTINDISIIRDKLHEDDCWKINETPGKRYSFVCDAIYHSATSQSPDFVNEIAVLCADATTRCPALMNDWVQALQDLCSPAQRSILDKIDIKSPLVMDNIAIFTAILVARRCLELSSFIKNALTIILGIEQQTSEAGIRLTCHLMLTWYRNTEYQSNQSRCSSFSPYTANNPFGVQSYDASGTPNFGASLLSSAPHSNLFQSMNSTTGNNATEMDNNQSSRAPLYLKYLCDHHLLRSACFNIKTEFHLLLLKAIKYLASFTHPGCESDLPGGVVKVENQFEDVSMDSMGLAGRNLDNNTSSSGLLNSSSSSFNAKHINLQTASLHQFADAVLRLLCSQRWLHDKCLSDSDLLASRNPLFDPRLDVKQSQGLLYMICYNKSPERQADVGLDDQGSDQVASIVKMFENLDVWSMRLSLVRLQFMYAYCKSQSSVNDWLDNLAKAVVEFFQKTSQETDTQSQESTSSSATAKDNSPLANGEASGEGSKKSKQTSARPNTSITNINKVWLVEPLLEKLDKPPSSIPSKIIKASAALMESASVRANSLPSLNQTYLSTAAASTKFKERTLLQRGSASTNPSNLASTSLLGFQPFLSLLLSCLKNQDKERETLLTSLNSQLYQAIHEKVDDIGYKQSIQDGLELRLCLIGQMFDTIQRSASLTSDWATLLLLLIMNNLVDPQVDYKLYVSVLDMLAMLIHSAYASDPIDQKEESKKQYQNLMKKFRKELAALEEKGFIQMKLINPLMPLVRQMTEVITCEPMGSLVDTKGEKVENFFSIDSKKGLKVAELQEVSPWELIEGHKNPAPLSWPWFGAIRLEHKPLRADENNRLMSWHTHMIRHSTSYFYQGPNTEEGPSSAKRGHMEKKPSQSNPLLKSLIEASDESSSLNKKDNDSFNSKSCIDDDSMYCEIDDDHFIGRDDFLEDYCELPLNMLFDSTPVETMIDDIKTAIQAEHAAMTSRVKPPAPQVVDARPIIGSAQQASSILAPIQPADRSAGPLSALQNHLNSSTASQDTSSMMAATPGGPASVPSAMVMSPLVNPQTPEFAPYRPPSNSIKIAPTPPPPQTPMSVKAPMSPMVGRSPAMSTTPAPMPMSVSVPVQVPVAVPQQQPVIQPQPVVVAAPTPKPKAPRKKRVTKKDQQNANAVIDANANLSANINKNAGQINIMGAGVGNYGQGGGLDTMNHTGGQIIVNQQPPKMVVNSQHNQMPMHPIQQQQPPTQNMIVRRGPMIQSQQQQQLQQQQASVYDFPYQPSQPTQQSNQFVGGGGAGGPMNSYYDQQTATGNVFSQSAQQAQQVRPSPQQQAPPQQQQMQMGLQAQHQQQHHPQQQQIQAQHMQQQQQHHQMQYQQQQASQHQHNPHQQHMQQAQQIRLAGHQQHQQQSMTFQQIQSHPQHGQQQMFAPQQAAGHSRPALTAMLHQKHAAAGNMDNKMHPPPRFNFPG